MKYPSSLLLLSFLAALALPFPLSAQQTLSAQQPIAREIPRFTEGTSMQPSYDTNCQECNAKDHQARALQMFEQGYLSEASTQYSAALAIYETLQQPEDAALCMAGLLRCYAQLPHGKQLEQTVHKALVYTNQSHDKVVVGTLLAGMGNYYHAIRNFTQAESCFQQALPILRRQQQPAGKALYVTTLSDMAAVQAHNQHPEAAMTACNKALRIAHKNNMTNELSHVHAQMASLYLEQGNTSEAFGYLNRAITSDSAAGKLANVAVLYLRKGDLLMTMGQPQSALMRYSESVQLAKTLQLNPLLSMAYAKLADTHTQLHHDSQAKVYTKLRQQIDATMKVAVE